MGKKAKIAVCEGTGCKSVNSDEIYEELKRIIDEEGLSIKLERTGCHGFCGAGPVLSVYPDNIFYVHVKPEDCKDIIDAIKNNTKVERLLFVEKDHGKKVEKEKMSELDFYKYQTRILLARSGEIDPFNLKEFLDRDGYKGLEKALKKKPDEVVQEIKDSGLRGRGGAGFPTGVKWSFLVKAEGNVKYMVCNADEGDPGSFMDRTLMEGDPFALLEGMTIGAYATGATKGFIYCRAEYPESIETLNHAIKKARENNYLGNNILGSEFSFDIEVKIGAGAFVCGEETALMKSIEGKRGMPRPKPPFPAQRGVWERPTNINNVKTFVSVSHIMKNGATWFKQFGTEKSPGTAVISLTGKVNNTGVVEVPMGTPLKDLIYKIGGGIKDNKKFKAVLTGGPSGGCLPENSLNLGIDFDSLASAGSIMGSGGVLVLNEDDSMVDVADYFLGFTVSESCGKCTPCREGLKRMQETLNRIKSGKGKEDDIRFLEELAPVIKDSASCGLGQTAPNPIITTLKYFRSEYEELLMPEFKYYYITKKCVGCGLCKKACPTGAISGEKGKRHVIDENKCVGCGKCYSSCPRKAIIYSEERLREDNKPLPK